MAKYQPIFSNNRVNMPIKLSAIQNKALKIVWKILSIGTFWLCVFLLFCYMGQAGFHYGQCIFDFNNNYYFSPAKVHLWFWLLVIAVGFMIWSWKHIANKFLKYCNYWWNFWLFFVSFSAFMNEIESSGKSYGATFGNLLFFEGGDFLLYAWCVLDMTLLCFYKRMRWYVAVLNILFFIGLLSWIILNS